MDWIPQFEQKRDRFQRAMVAQGNAAYAAGLALLMAGDGRAAEWLGRAAARWRESWDAGAPADAWGRPIGALKASLLARDESALEALAPWTLELGTATAESPIGRYAATLALLTLERWPEARHVAESLRERDDFPRDVADALAYVAAHDVVGYVEARIGAETIVERDDFPRDVADALLMIAGLDRNEYAADVLSVLESFERRSDFLEDVRVADTVLVLQALAAQRDMAIELPTSALLPS